MLSRKLAKSTNTLVSFGVISSRIVHRNYSGLLLIIYRINASCCFSGVTFAGLIADSRTLVERAQIEAQNFWFTYNRKIRVEDVTQSVANLALQFGDDDVKASMSRPFGVAMLFAGVDQEGAKLFHLDPSGTFIDCKAKSIGAASDGAEQNLKEQYHDVNIYVVATLM